MSNVGKALREKLGNGGVDSLIDLINQSRSDQKAEILEIVEEKFERRLSEEMGKVRQEMAEMKIELNGNIAGAKAEKRLSVFFSSSVIFIRWIKFILAFGNANL